MSILANRLKTLRKNKNLSQESLGETTGLSRRQLSGYETDEMNPPLETLVALAHALETTTDYLLGLTDNPSRDPANVSTRNPMQQEIIDLVESRDEEFQRRLLTLIHLLDDWR